MIHDVFYLIEDVLNGSIPFDTMTEIKTSNKIDGINGEET